MRILLILLLAAASGCAVRPPWPEPEKTASFAAGIDGAIELRLEAGPVDDPQFIGGDHLELSQAIRQALRNSPDIQIALARVRAAQAEAHQSRLLPNPVVSVVLRWSLSGGSPVVEAGLAAELLSLLKKPGQISAADDHLRAVSAEAVTSVLDVLAELQNSYVQAQSLDALTPIFHERQRLLNQMHAVAESRLRAGEGTRLDVTTLQAQLVELQVEMAEHELERREARLTLARLIGRPSDAADWQLESYSASPPAQTWITERQWLAAAMTHRPEIQALHWELLAMGAEVKLTGLAWLEGDQAGVDAEYDAGWSVGPSLSVPLPLFDWGQARRQNATARQIQAMHRLTAVQRQVIEDVRRAHASFIATQQTLTQVRDQLIVLLERRQQDTESAYRAGHSDVIALILAQQELQAGRASLIQLERKSRESLIRLHRAVGGPGHAPPSENSHAQILQAAPAQETTP